MKREKIVLMAGLVILVATAARAEFRVWKDIKGGAIEAEFANETAGAVTLVERSGKTIKINRKSLSAEDNRYLDLNVPPKLTIKIGCHKDDEASGRIERQFVTCSAMVAKSGYSPYAGTLEVELFVFGKDDRNGDIVLVKRTKENFALAQDKSDSREFKTPRIELVYGRGSLDYGAEYDGCLAVVLDQSGNIVNIKANRAFYELNATGIMQLKEGNAFDKTLAVTVKNWDAGELVAAGGGGGRGGGGGGRGGGKR